jgi:hypothetical protein
MKLSECTVKVAARKREFQQTFENIHNVRKIRAFVVRGHYLERAALDSLLPGKIGCGSLRKRTYEWPLRSSENGSPKVCHAYGWAQVHAKRFHNL